MLPYCQVYGGTRDQMTGTSWRNWRLFTWPSMLQYFPEYFFNTCMIFCDKKLLLNMRRPIQNPFKQFSKSSNIPNWLLISQNGTSLTKNRRRFLMLLTHIDRLLSCCFWLRCKKAGFDLQCHDGNYVNKIPHNAKRNGEICFAPREDVSWNKRKKRYKTPNIWKEIETEDEYQKRIQWRDFLLPLLEFQVRRIKLSL